MTSSRDRLILCATLACALGAFPPIGRAQDGLGITAPPISLPGSVVTSPEKAAEPATDGKKPKPTPNSSAKKNATADPSKKILADAIATLTTEFQASQKKEGATALREKANFFETTPPELTPDKVVAAISKPVAANPVQDAYIRWQLTSALPSDLDEKLAVKLMQAYRSAPRPLARLGVAASERKELDNAIRDKNANSNTLTSQLAAAQDKRTALNAPILAFRDVLFQRLPAGPETFLAGMSDAADRYQAGIRVGGEEQLKSVQQRVQLWAVSSDKLRGKDVVYSAVDQLRKLKEVEYPVEVEAAEGGQRRWRIDKSAPDKRILDDIQATLKTP